MGGLPLYCVVGFLHRITNILLSATFDVGKEDAWERKPDYFKGFSKKLSKNLLLVA